MRILLLSAYSAHSHQVWCDNLLKMFPEHDWQLLTLPGRYFNWRIRGNALSWGLGQRNILEQQYDRVVATSMVDCATLRGLVPSLANVPWLVYFHENQFEYPVSAENDHTEPKMVSLYNALCAEQLVFNTDYNYQTFIAGLDTFLKKMPDEVPDNTLDVIANKHKILPVPVTTDKIKPSIRNNSIPVLLWNHRWEYDKGPDQLCAFLDVLRQRNFAFKINLIGQQFRTIPTALLKIKKEFADELLNYGFIESSGDYNRILQQSDFILSTALHDFQGLAVLEAVASGCIPVVPDRLSYKEIFPKKYRYQSEPSSLNNEAENMVKKLISLDKDRLNMKLDLDDINITDFSIEKLKPLYLAALFSG